MKWYITKLVFNIQVGSVSQTEFDEQLRLINAADTTDAFLKARTIGKKEEDTFMNDKGERVTWKFIDVMELQPLQNFEHGKEIYSFTCEHRKPEDYINFIKRNAQVLQLQHTTFA